MASLGDLFYNIRLRDLTDQSLSAIANKLKNIGLQIDPANLRKSIEDAITGQNAVKVSFDPQISSKDIESKLTGQVVNAVVTPQTEGLAQRITDALRSQEVWIDNLKIDPSKLSAAISASFQGAGFASMGDSIADGVAKSVKTRLDGQTFDAKVQIKPDILASSIIKDIEKAEKKEFRLKFDSKTFLDEIKAAVKGAVKVTIDPAIKASDIESKLEGKIIKAHIEPLASELRKGIKDACSSKDGEPATVDIGPNAGLLHKLVTDVLNRQGFMLTISSVTGLDEAVKKVTKGKHDVKLTVDPKAVSDSVKQALNNVQSKTFGLEVAKNVLYNSIDTALKGHPFTIEVKALEGQVRQAIQKTMNATANNTNLNNTAKQADNATRSVNRLASAHRDASSAAGVHARASLNLGGALGSNIRIAGDLGTAFASLYSVHAIKEFLSQVVEIGGELEHQKIALSTIYGGEGKTNELFSNIKGLARNSPFGVMEITKSVKALAAYGVQYNEVYDTAKRLADISAATSVDINRLILAFGKTKSRTFLDGLEAKQFAYANIPIYDLLSKKLTELEGQFVSVTDVMGRIKKREIGFDLVKEVLWDCTDAGGKFYNMQEALAGSVKTSWKLVRDNIELMFGEIAEGSVGSGLKSLGQMMQEVTRHWQIFAGVGTVAFGGFLIYKTAVSTCNAALAKHNVSLLSSVAAQNKETLSKMTGASVYRRYTAEENRALQIKQALNIINNKNIWNSQRLTAQQVKALVAEKALNKDLALRLIAMRKITRDDAQYLVEQKLITQAEMDRARAAAVSTNRLGMLNSRFRMLGATIGSKLGNAFKSLLSWSSALMAILAAGVALYTRNREEAQKMEEISGNIFTKASEGAKNLKDMLKDMKAPEEMSEVEVSQSVEQLVNAIKDYSPTPIDDVNKSLVDHNGHLLNAQERLVALRKRVEELKNAYDQIDLDTGANGLTAAIEGALKHTDEGWFNDGLVENAKDYTNALKRQSELITTYSTTHRKGMEEMVRAAMNADKGFKDATDGMADYQLKLRYLIDNMAKFPDAVEAFNKSADRMKLKGVGAIANKKQIDAAYNELLSDTDKFIAAMNTKLTAKGWNLSKLTEMQKMELSISLKNMVDQMEGASEEAKNVMLDKFDKAYGLAINPDKIGPRMREIFTKSVKESTNAAVLEAMRIIRFKGYEGLSQTQKKLIDDLMTQAKNQTMNELKLNVDQMKAYLAANPGEWHVGVVIQESFGGTPNDLYKEIVSKKGMPSGNVDSLVDKWTKDGSIYSGRNAALSDLQDAKNELDAATKVGQGVEKAQKKYNEIIAAINYAGWGDLASKLKDQKSNKSPKNGSQKDALAEALRQRFKDIKDAWSEYQKFEKSFGSDEAFRRIGESGLFSTLPADKIPKTAEEYKKLVTDLEDELRKAGVKGHSQRESLLNEILKQELDLDKSIFDDNVKEMLNECNRLMERQLADWNLYDNLVKATGNEKLAISIAFNEDKPATDYAKLLKKQFDDTIAKLHEGNKDIPLLKFDDIDYSNVKNLNSEIQKLWENTTKKIDDYSKQQRTRLNDFIKEYQTSQEKIVALEAEAKKKIADINAKDEDGNYLIPNPVRRQQLTERVNAALDYKVFQQSAQYLNFFNGILSMTKKEAEAVGDKIKEALDKQLQAGAISAKEYCDEIEKIKKQLKEIDAKTSGVGSFVKGGLNSYFEQKRKQAESDYNTAVNNYQQAKEQFDIAEADGDEAGMEFAKNAMEGAESMKEGAAAAMKGAEGAMTTLGTVSVIVHKINETIQGVHEAYGMIADMADSFGIDTSADTGWGATGAALDALSQASEGATKAFDSLMSGNVGGVIAGVTQSITSWFTVFNRWHDSKIDRKIERSKQAYEELGYVIDAIERRLTNYIGNGRNLKYGPAEEELKRYKELQGIVDSLSSKPKLSLIDSYALYSASKELDKMDARMKAYMEGGAFGYQRQAMKEQLAELQRQRDLEAGKKKSDSAAIAEYDNQIDELTQKIKDYAIEMADSVYGIDLSGWADQIGESLVDAFSKGEDAAEAFKKSVGDIMRSLVSKMISADIIAPMFADLEEFLFGKDGMGGAYGNDFLLDATEASKMGQMLLGIEDAIGNSKDLYDQINSALGGLLDDTESSSNSARAGIQGITEQTADLLASYINAIRADLSMQVNILWPQLIDYLSGSMVIAESQVKQLQAIAENTRRNMIAAESILATSQSIHSILRNATQSSSQGFYMR